MGRTAIHAVLIVDDQFRDLIYQQASMARMRETARMAGFETIHQDAAKKAASGVTSISELIRALG